MQSFVTRLFGPRRVVILIAAIAIGVCSVANAAVISYVTSLSGAAEAPPNASPGTGFSQVDVDPVAHTMSVHIDFTGLIGNTSASHIHGATLVAGAGTAGVMTTTPTFAGFPLGVTAGNYDIVMDLTLASSYNPSFVTAQGSIAAAETYLLNAIAAGKAYVNVHSSAYPPGEIRGFLQPNPATPTERATWGRIKRLYR